jgi:hypothetical protein
MKLYESPCIFVFGVNHKNICQNIFQSKPWNAKAIFDTSKKLY